MVPLLQSLRSPNCGWLWRSVLLNPHTQVNTGRWTFTVSKEKNNRVHQPHLLLNNKSTRPNYAVVALKRLLTDDSSLTSVGTRRVRLASATAVCSRASRRQPPSTTE